LAIGSETAQCPANPIRLYLRFKHHSHRANLTADTAAAPIDGAAAQATLAETTRAGVPFAARIALTSVMGHP
jgi:hypothetical protein